MGGEDFCLGRRWHVPWRTWWVAWCPAGASIRTFRHVRGGRALDQLHMDEHGRIGRRFKRPADVQIACSTMRRTR